MNGDGVIPTWAAMAVRHSMIGLDAAEVFDCRPSVAFGIDNAGAVDRVAFVVDYSNAGVAFTNQSGNVHCRAAEVVPVAGFATTDDPVKKVLSVQIEFAKPITGSLGVAECAALPPESGDLPGPGAYLAVVTEQRGATDPDGTTVSVLPGG